MAISPLVFETDNHGRFEVAIPDVDGVIGVVGDVPGHICVSNWNQRQQYEKFAPGLQDEFTRILEQGRLDDLDEFQFELRLSYTLAIDANDFDGFTRAQLYRDRRPNQDSKANDI